MEHASFGVASCVVFGLVVACFIIGGFGLATASPSTGGDFSGDFGQALGSGFLMAGGWMLSLLGCALAMAGFMQQGKNTNSAAIGIGLNGLAAIFGLIWLLSQ